MSSETPSLDAAMDEIRLAGTMLGGISTDLQWAPERARLHATIRAAESRIRTTVRALQARIAELEAAAVAWEEFALHVAHCRECGETMYTECWQGNDLHNKAYDAKQAAVRSQEDSANG